MARFGEQLRKLRESKEMSIKDYADLIPLSVSYLSEIERGLKPSPGMKMIERIAEVLDVKPDYFDEYKAEKVKEAVLCDARLDLMFKMVIKMTRKEREEVISYIKGLTDKGRKESLDLFDSHVDALLEHIERSFRVSGLEEVAFTDYRDILGRTMSSGNHLIRGRQGTGKTTLLRKAHMESLQRGNVSFYLDAEVHKNLSYPESLIRILQEIFSALGDIIRENLDRSDGGLIGQFVESSRRKKDLENLRRIGEAVDGKILFLEDLLREYVYVELSQEGAGKKEAALRESKGERLEKEAINLGLILEGICKVGGNRAMYIHIDDFQFLSPADQARILDFLHRISKGKRIFLKISMGSGNSTAHPGDFETLSLDPPLEDFAEIRRFMEMVLELHGESREARAGSLLSLLKNGKIFSGMVLASGGVVRDFLKIFRRSVRVARSREARLKQGTLKVDSEDVKSACLEFLVEDKYAALRSLSEPSSPAHLIYQIRSFCREKSSCFFNVKDKDAEEKKILTELVGLRLLHPVFSVAVRSGREEGWVYMLDAGICLEDGIPVPLEEDDPVGPGEIPVFRIRGQ